MMWFRKPEKIEQQNTEQQLNELATDGVNLSLDELMRYQSKSSLININAVRNLHGKMSGNYLARSKGRGMEFDEVRHYQTGDDIRAIDWRVTARTGTTHTKLFREEIERPVQIITDLSHNMLFGSKLLFKSVQAAHLAALVAWHAKSRGDRIGGIVFNQQQHTELKPRSRQQGVLHYLNTLIATHKSSIELQHKTSVHDAKADLFFEENCLRARQISRPGSLVYFITDGHSISQEAIRHLSSISQHCELVMCLLSDPLEHELPESKTKVNVSISDGINQQQLTLGDTRTADFYRYKAEVFNQTIEQSLTKAGARLLHFSAGQSIEHQLKDGVASWIR
ncbi:DUF58 domain-containing protein [Thalassotalea profundi]|uniref:DUF58 domain-containing protein n=1 Tax=Thalassotalea profundi TaxID=2036687 RepID=A0ABQ3IH85_9GAMM|nr:DUF58 domain-containing protein [Thalassotalea profundi]GHE80342.1 hypothetical protein GCM10011501_05270 [Thalassotalea profundi]